jgi:type IV pilus assembly protein PilB
MAARWPEHVVNHPRSLWKPVGCRTCSNTGYRGRLALHEVMPVTESIERLAVQRASANDIHRVALAEGMHDLRVDGLYKAAEGHTSVQEIIRVAI